MKKLLKDHEVAERLGCSPSTVWRYSKNIAGFPRPVRIGNGNTGWLEGEVDAFIEKAAERRVA